MRKIRVDAVTVAKSRVNSSPVALPPLQWRTGTVQDDNNVDIERKSLVEALEQ